MDLEKLGERSIMLDCDVLQAEAARAWRPSQGPTSRSPCDESTGEVQRLPKSPLTGASRQSAWHGRRRTLLDLCYEEDSRAEVDANIVMTDAGRFVEYQATAETRASTTSRWRA